MKSSTEARSGRAANRIALAVGLLAAGLTWYLSVRTPAAALAGDGPWWVLLFAPGVLGVILVGGVHGSAPYWLLIAAPSVVNGLAWGLVARAVARALVRPRDPSAWRE